MFITGMAIPIAQPVIEGNRFPCAKVGGSDAHYYEMMGNGCTISEGYTEGDPHQHIKGSKTLPDRKMTSLIQGIRWNISITEYRLRNLPGNNKDPSLEQTGFERKAPGVIGDVIHLTPPISLVGGVISDTTVKNKSHEMWGE